MKNNIANIITENVEMDIVELRQDLANYIMSVQSLVDRLHIMEMNKSIDFTYINKRVMTLEEYEDNLLLKLSSMQG